MAFPEDPIYKLVNDPITGKLSCINAPDGLFIPVDETNKDYQEYLKWVEEGNTAEEAD